MKPISRVGDANQAGGKLLMGAFTVLANGKPVATHPSFITPHPPHKDPRHACAFTTGGSLSVFAEGKPVVRIGTGNTCGHSIIQGSKDIFVP